MADPVTVSPRVVVPAAPDQVWQAVVDWPGHHRRIIATCVYADQGPGATVVGRTGIGPLGFAGTMVITGWELPRRCALHHIGPLVHRDALFTVTPAALAAVQLDRATAAANGSRGTPGLAGDPPAAATRNAYVTDRFARLFPPGNPPEPTARAEQVQDCLTRSTQLCLLSPTPRERRLSASLTRLPSPHWSHAAMRARSAYRSTRSGRLQQTAQKGLCQYRTAGGSAFMNRRVLLRECLARRACGYGCRGSWVGWTSLASEFLQHGRGVVGGRLDPQADISGVDGGEVQHVPGARGTVADPGDDRPVSAVLGSH
jgi:hypothetical protein